MTDNERSVDGDKPSKPLTLGQKIAVGVILSGLGAVFLAVCYRLVLWILGAW
jgi:hypothetical protein